MPHATTVPGVTGFNDNTAGGVLVTLLGDVAKNYIDLRGLQRQLVVAQQNLAAQQDTLGLTKVRFEAGLASDFEVAQAEGLVNSTAAQIPTLQSALKQAAYRAKAGAAWKENDLVFC